jgi:hypothetical protein
VNGVWLDEIESLEAIAGDEDTRRLFLRMAQMSQAGRLEPFLDRLAYDPELDDETKGAFAELAQDASFLLAVQEYVVRTRQLH